MNWVSMPMNEPVGGRLKPFLPNWRLITTDAKILSIVKGYKLELTSEQPRRSKSFVPRFSREESEKLDNEVDKLLQKKAIKQVSKNRVQYMSHLFLRLKKDGTFRPVFNLRSLNRFVRYQHFKIDGMKELKNAIIQGDWMVTIDLKDAYLTVPVSKEHQPLLSFEWKKRYFQFQVLPFGLASAPRVFTKLLKPVMALLRRLNIRTQIYLDDLILLNQDPSQLEQDKQSVLFLLQNLGFIINWEKSQLLPARAEVEYLGFLINSVSMELTLPERKIQKIKRQCQWLRTQKNVTIRELAQTIGQLVASTEAILPAPMYVRHSQVLKIQALKANAKNYAQKITLNQEARDELQWWIENIDHYNGKAIITPHPDMELITDASKKGWGATNGTNPTQGLWSENERKLHINALELKAADYAVRAYTKKMTDIHIHMKLDNKTAVAYIMKMGGTRSKVLLSVAQEMWKYCLENRITLTAEYLPGVQNVEADRQSRVYQDNSNWSLQKEAFLMINRLMGPLEIDMFADRLNTQLEQYASWKPDPGAIATDAFTVNWDSSLAYLFPPFNQIGRCLQKVTRDKTTAVIVTPIWSTQIWYSTLLEMSCQQPLMLPNKETLLMSPQGEHHPLLQQGLRLAAWKITANHWLRQDFRRTLPNTSRVPAGKAHKLLTKGPGISGAAGVINNKLILFQRL